MMDNSFLGLNNFIWWFGVVENRLDPLELGRCQVRCFGWHNDDINQIPIDKLPWAHPVVPYGIKAVQPPAEGTMVFGFFADGNEGQYPIILGTVPGIPDEIRENNLGFTDPYTEDEKASQSFPRKIREAIIRPDTRGVQIQEDVAKRNPSNLNEPTLSRLARPVRGVTEGGEYDGIASESIANTTIDIQRKTRITSIPTAAGSVWDEPYPAYNAQYPFNNVTETESGHAFEMDDTKEFERVQLSHRTGSTLEFLPEGHTKLKSQSGRYDVTMGDHRNYVNGTKYETIDSDYFLKINGKFRIECDQFQLICAGNPGTAEISAQQSVDVSGTTFAASGLLSSKVTGGVSAEISSGGVTTVSSAGKTSILGGIAATIKSKLVGLIGEKTETVTIINTTTGIQDFNSCIPTVTDKLDVTPPNIPTTVPIDLPPPKI
jgi:hypothetical protein